MMSDRERVTLMSSQILRHTVLSGDYRVWKCGKYSEQVVEQVKQLLEDNHNGCRTTKV